MFRKAKFDPKPASTLPTKTMECKTCSKEQEMETFARELSRLSMNMDEFHSTVTMQGRQLSIQGDQISQIREDMGFVRGLLEAKFQTKVRK